jgi:chromosome segregation ATPase
MAAPVTTPPATDHAGGPTAAAAGAAAAMNALEPMPVEGPIALFSCLPYWFSVFSARMKRAGIIRRFQSEVQQEQRKLDEILRDLGKRAREIELQHPPLEAVMAALRQLEGERAQLEADTSGLTSELEAAQKKFDSISEDCNGRITAAQQEASETQTALNEKNGELRSLKAQVGQIDKELSRLAGALRSKTAQGAKAQDAEKQAALEQEAVNLQAQIEEQEKKRGEVEAKVSEVEGPVGELTARLTDARGRIQEAQKELAAARQELAGTKQKLGVEEQRKGQEMTRLDQAMAQNFLEIGQLLEKDRVQNPSLEELFGRIDETKNGLQDRETHVAALSAERDNYDRAAAQKGLILLLSGVGLVFLVILALILLVVFVFD